MKRLAAGYLLAAAVCVAQIPFDIRDASAQLEQKAKSASAALGVEFRIRAAEALHSGWPELSQELAMRSVTRLQSKVGWRLTPEVMRSLTLLDPEGAISVLPRMQVSYAGFVIDSLAQLHRIDDARSVYRAALARGGRVTAAFGLFIQLLNEKSPQIGDVYADMLSGFSFDALTPQDAFWIDSQLTEPVAKITPGAAIQGAIRMLDAASNPGFGKSLSDTSTGDFQVASNLITATNSRDTILLLAGARLFSLAPAEFEKRKVLFSAWGGVGPVVVKALRPGTTDQDKTTFKTERIPTKIQDIATSVDDLSEQSAIGDDQVIRLATQLRSLPPDWGKLEAAKQLSDVALRHQVGRRAMAAAASALLFAIHDCHPVLDPGQVATSFSEDYVRAAELIRYGRVQPPRPDPGLSAAEALLALQERVLEHAGFTVTDLNGDPRTISPVPGEITLISLVSNACARYRPTCDRPLPALEDLSKEYANRGVAIFAIAEEGLELFTESLDGEKFTVPVFIDTDNTFAKIFGAPGRHEYFLFNSQGKLVEREIGIRTLEQLREMLKKFGAG